MVLAVAVTQAHTSAKWEAGATLLDEANARVDGRIEVVSADAGYGVERVLAEVEARGLEAPIAVPGTHDIRPEPTRHLWTGKVLEHAAARRARMRRLAMRGRNRALCAAGKRGYRISRKLRLRIAHPFGQAKTCHGLGRARYRGLAKVQRQMLLTAAAINLKRLGAPLGRRRAPAKAGAKRVECTFSLPFSAHIRLQQALTGLQAALTGIQTPALLGGRHALLHS